MSDSEPELHESEASILFSRDTEREFRRVYCGKKESLPYNVETERQIRKLEVQVAEANAKIAHLQRLIEVGKAETNGLRVAEREAFEKVKILDREIQTLRAELRRLKKLETEFEHEKLTNGFTFSNYRAALAKYRTWYEYSLKQLETVRDILREHGKWTPEIQYRIFFSYKGLTPIDIADDDVATLAEGSIVDYKGIDDVENICSVDDFLRYKNTSTQTDYVSDDSTASHTESSTGSVIPLSSIRMRDDELNFLDLRDRIQRLESENVELKEKLYVARAAVADRAVLNEENNALKSQIEVLTESNNRLLTDHEQLLESVQNGVFTELTGPNNRLTFREVMDKVLRTTKQNTTLLRENIKLEDQVRSLSKANSQQSGDTTALEADKSVLPVGDESTMHQTATDSTVFCHMKVNPRVVAFEEYEEREQAKKRKLEECPPSYDPQPLFEALEEVQKLKNENERLSKSMEKSEAIQREFVRRYRESVRLITGYDIKMRTEEYVEAAPIYDSRNQFCFQRIEKKCSLLENEYVKKWSSVFDRYLAGMDSLPCFTAGVTIELRRSQLADESTALGTTLDA